MLKCGIFAPNLGRIGRDGLRLDTMGFYKNVVGVVEAAGSSPVTQTSPSVHKGIEFFMDTRFFYAILPVAS